MQMRPRRRRGPLASRFASTAAALPPFRRKLASPKRTFLAGSFGSGPAHRSADLSALDHFRRRTKFVKVEHFDLAAGGAVWGGRKGRACSLPEGEGNTDGALSRITRRGDRGAFEPGLGSIHRRGSIQLAAPRPEAGHPRLPEVVVVETGGAEAPVDQIRATWKRVRSCTSLRSRWRCACTVESSC